MKFISKFCPRVADDKWLYLSAAIALIPVWYSLLNGLVSYMTINLLVACAVAAVLFSNTLLGLINKRKINITKNPVYWFLMAFVLWLFISSAFSVDKKASFLGMIDGKHSHESVFQFLAYLGFGISATKIKKENKDWLLSLLIFLSCFYIFMGLINPSKTFVGFSKNTEDYSLMFLHPNHSGYIMCMTGVMAAAKVLTSRKWWVGICFGVAFALHVFFLIINGSLGPILGFIIGLLVLITYMGVKNKKTLKISCVLLVAFFALASILDFVPKIKELRREEAPLYAKIAGTICFLVGKDYKYEELSVSGADGYSRPEMWKSSLKDAAKRPLLGYGLSTFKIMHPEYELNNPHNEYLQYMSQGGIPVLMFYLAALISLVVLVLKNKRLSSTGVCATAGVAAYAVSAFFGNTICGVMPLFSLVFGVAASEAI